MEGQTSIVDQLNSKLNISIVLEARANQTLVLSPAGLGWFFLSESLQAAAVASVVLRVHVCSP